MSLFPAKVAEFWKNLNNLFLTDTHHLSRSQSGLWWEPNEVMSSAKVCALSVACLPEAMWAHIGCGCGSSRHI